MQATGQVRSFATSTRHQVVILGGGFGGVYTAMRLERLRRAGTRIDVTLVNRENYLVFQPLLAEVASGVVGILESISPLRRLLPQTEIVVREIETVDLAARLVTLGPGLTPRQLELSFDSLVVALGSVTDSCGIPGLAEHALPFRTLADAVSLRNHLIHVFEQASLEADAETRRSMLTFVVAGGGFSGTEIAAQINDFVARARAFYRRIGAKEARVVLVHSGPRVLERELTERLSAYATRALRARGVELVLETRLVAASRGAAVLGDGRSIPTRTLVSTIGAGPNPIIEALEAPKERGRLICEPTLRVRGREGVWSLGDCAQVPAPGGGAAPHTAQHAIRQARVVAGNIAAALHGRAGRRYDFVGLGKLGALGHHRAVVELPGGMRLSGLPAWLVWRGVYWSKLPGASRKARVAISWLADLLLPPDPLEVNLGSGGGVGRAHFEPGEIVFHQGDFGDSLYMVLLGEAEILGRRGEDETVLSRVGPGEFFGELALMGRRERTATVRAVTPLDLLTLPRADFAALLNGLPALRRSIEEVAARRAARDAALAREQ